MYVGLRIPDADTSSRQSIDIVLVTKGYYDFSLFLFFFLNFAKVIISFFNYEKCRRNSSFLKNDEHTY